MVAKTLNIVLVDDDELILELVERRLRGSLCQLTTFSDELLALEYLRHNKPDILLIDQRMPRLDGLDLLRELAGALPAQVYLCSGARLPANLQARAEEFGAQILSKDLLVEKEGLVSLLELTAS